MEERAIFIVGTIMGEKKKKRNIEILVVDDDKYIITSIKKIFEPDKFIIISAGNIEEGRRKALDHNPDIIIMDLIFSNGEENGNDFLVSRLDDEVLKGIPVIVCSKKNNAEVVEKTVALGANEYIVKPFDKVKFRKKVHKFLEGYKILNYSYSPGRELSVNVPTQVTNIFEKGFKISSPVRMSNNDKVEINSQLLQGLGVGNKDFIVDVSYLLNEDGQFKCEIHLNKDELIQESFKKSEKKFNVYALLNNGNNVEFLEKITKELSGTNLKTFDSGEKFLEALLGDTPDVAILDINFNGEEEEGDKILENYVISKTSDTKMIIFQNKPDTQAFEKYRSYLNFEFLTKPFHFEALKIKLAVLLNLGTIQLFLNPGGLEPSKDMGRSSIKLNLQLMMIDELGMVLKGPYLLTSGTEILFEDPFFLTITGSEKNTFPINYCLFNEDESLYNIFIEFDIKETSLIKNIKKWLVLKTPTLEDLPEDK